MIRSYTYVWPATHSGLDLDTPFLVLAPDDDADLAELYLPTSLHRVDHEVMPYQHAAMLGTPVTVDDAWIRAVTAYDDTVKCVAVLSPPRQIAAADPLTAQMIGPDVPAWAGALLLGHLSARTRDILVSSGRDHRDVAAIMIDPAAPTTLPGWVEQVIEPPTP